MAVFVWLDEHKTKRTHPNEIPTIIMENVLNHELCHMHIFRMIFRFKYLVFFTENSWNFSRMSEINLENDMLAVNMIVQHLSRNRIFFCYSVHFLIFYHHTICSIIMITNATDDTKTTKMFPLMREGYWLFW